MTLKAHIELPYDRGHPWHLVVGEERAIVSERAATVLIGRFKIAVEGEPALTEKLSGLAALIGSGFWLSKKARKLLKSAGVEIEL